MRIVVIGGGISGLACGHGLMRELPHADVMVLEASPRAGGVIGTTCVAGHRFDDGPGGWLNRDDSTQSLLAAVGLDECVIGGKPENRVRFVWKDGKLRRFPSDLASFLKTDLLSAGAKLRVLVEPWIPWKEEGEDRDVAALFEHRVGHEAMRVLIDPVLAGIYAGQPEELSLRATLPAIAKLVAGRRSLVKQAFASRNTGAGVGGGYASLREGMGALPEALAAALGSRFVPNAPVESLGRGDALWQVKLGGESPRELEADVVVLATPSRVSQRLVAPVDRDIESFFETVPTSPVAVVGLGYREEDVPRLAGYGHLIPSTERGAVLGVLWSSSIFEGRAERGVSLRVILGGWRDREIHTRSDEQLTGMARDEVASALGISAEPEALATARHVHGLPQYRVGHLDRVEALTATLKRHRGLYVIGNAVNGVGVNSCTSTAAKTVSAIADYCGSLA